MSCAQQEFNKWQLQWLFMTSSCLATQGHFSPRLFLVDTGFLKCDRRGNSTENPRRGLGSPWENNISASVLSVLCVLLKSAREVSVLQCSRIVLVTHSELGVNEDPWVFFIPPSMSSWLEILSLKLKGMSLHELVIVGTEWWGKWSLVLRHGLLLYTFTSLHYLKEISNSRFLGLTLGQLIGDQLKFIEWRDGKVMPQRWNWIWDTKGSFMDLMSRIRTAVLKPGKRNWHLSFIELYPCQRLEPIFSHLIITIILRWQNQSLDIKQH